MPRINVDDKFFADHRYYDLAEKIGCRIMALGVAVSFWRLGQQYYKNQKPIPKAIFFKQKHAQEFLDVGLARRIRGGFYIHGSESHFAWIVSRIESSRKGGESLKKKWAETRPTPGPPAPDILGINSLSAKGVDSITSTKLTRQEIEEQKKKMFELFGD